MSGRRLVVLLAALAAASGCGSGTRVGGDPHPARARTRPLRVLVDGRVVLTASVPERGAVAAASAVAARLPTTVRLRRGDATVTADVARGPATAALARALRARLGAAQVPAQPVESSIALAPVQQTLHNDCEAAALSVLLAGAGVHVDQVALQRELPTSGPIDPQPVAGSSLPRWGDPEQGFVGHVDGSGPWGGFGVYEPPVRALAARHGVRLDDLEGSSVGSLLGVVLSGRPVLAWVGLEDGPYETWLTPRGTPITVNLNEHAVVLVGAGPGYVLVDDPLHGTRSRWPDSLFVTRWLRLGRRALALPPAH